MIGVIRAGMLMLAALLTFTASARAELRTGGAPNRYAVPEDSYATHPVLKRADVRYDDQAGSIQVTITLYDGLADPSVTSALRPWRFAVVLGDFLNSICTGDDRTGLLMTGAFADPAQAVLDGYYDVDETDYPDIPVAQALSADRDQITLSAVDPRLVALNTSCADVRVFDILAVPLTNVLEGLSTRGSSRSPRSSGSTGAWIASPRGTVGPAAG